VSVSSAVARDGAVAVDGGVARCLASNTCPAAENVYECRPAVKQQGGALVECKAETKGCKRVKLVTCKGTTACYAFAVCIQLHLPCHARVVLPSTLTWYMVTIGWPAGFKTQQLTG
jgi:hypothetical protein